MRWWFHIIFGVLLAKGAYGQTSGTVSVVFTLPLVAMLDVAGGTGIGLNFLAPAEAGSPVVSPPANTALWLNFTSAVSPSLTRRVTGQMSGSLPPGVSLTLLLTGPSGAGAGVRGTAGGQIALNASVQTLVNGIGGAYTGDGIYNGYNLNYSVTSQNYTQLRAGSGSVTVLFTLMDN